jgi:hypothetical protein
MRRVRRSVKASRSDYRTQLQDIAMRKRSFKYHGVWIEPENGLYSIPSITWGVMPSQYYRNLTLAQAKAEIDRRRGIR